MSWNRTLVGALACAVLAGAAPGLAQVHGTGAQAQAQPSQPQRGALDFENEDLDIGIVHDGAPIDVVYPFTNEGEIPIMITRVKPSCGCTNAADMEGMVIQPGETGELRFVFNPTGKIGGSSVSIRVETDDPDRPTMNLMLRAEIEPIVQADPSIIQFGDLRKGESKSITTRVSGEMENFKVLFATVSDSDLFEVEVVEHARIEMPAPMKVGVDTGEQAAPRSRDGSIIKITFKGSDDIGVVDESLLGRTTDERRRLIPIKMLGNVVGDVEVVPDRIGLGILRPGEAFEKTLHVSSRSGEAFEITAASLDVDITDEFEVDVLPLATDDGSSAYKVRIHGTPSPDHAQRRPLRGDLVLETNVDGEEVLKFKLFGQIRPVVTPRQPSR